MSLNNLGRVAFTAFDDDFTREAVFTGRGVECEMLNARGQVAVKVTFDDFSEAIVRATPRP